MDCKKIDQMDLDSLCRELSVCGLGFVIIVLVYLQIRLSCVCVYWGSNTAVAFLIKWKVINILFLREAGMKRILMGEYKNPLKLTEVFINYA